MAFCHHLRPDEDSRPRGREPFERFPKSCGTRSRIRIEPNTFESGDLPCELRLQPLRPGPDPGELDRSAGRTSLREHFGVSAVMAVETPVGVKRERHVAAPTSPGRAARTAVESTGHPAAIDEEDRAPAALLECRELCEKWSRQRVSSLSTEIDEPHGRHWRSDALGQPKVLEPRPALGTRRSASVDGDRRLERRSLRGNGTRVIPRVGLLLVRRVVLLVHDDQAEA